VFSDKLIHRFYSGVYGKCLDVGFIKKEWIGPLFYVGSYKHGFSSEGSRSFPHKVIYK